MQSPSAPLLSFPLSFKFTRGSKCGRKREGWMDGSDLHTKLGAHSNPEILNVSPPTCCSMWTHCWMTEKSVDLLSSLLNGSSQSQFMDVWLSIMTANKKPDLSPKQGRGSLPPSSICIFVSDNFSKADVQIYRAHHRRGGQKCAGDRGHQHMWMTDWLPLIVLHRGSEGSSLHIKLLACVAASFTVETRKVATQKDLPNSDWHTYAVHFV